MSAEKGKQVQFGSYKVTVGEGLKSAVYSPATQAPSKEAPSPEPSGRSIAPASTETPRTAPASARLLEYDPNNPPAVGEGFKQFEPGTPEYEAALVQTRDPKLYRGIVGSAEQAGVDVSALSQRQRAELIREAAKTGEITITESTPLKAGSPESPAAKAQAQLRAQRKEQAEFQADIELFKQQEAAAREKGETLQATYVTRAFDSGEVQSAYAQLDIPIAIQAPTMLTPGKEVRRAEAALQVQGNQYKEAFERTFGPSAHEVKYEELSVAYPSQRRGFGIASPYSYEMQSESGQIVPFTLEVKETTRVLKPTEIEVEDDTFEGFKNYFSNIPASIQATGEKYILGKEPTVEIKPEIEGMAVGTTVEYFASLAKARNIADVYFAAVKAGGEYKDIGTFIEKHPKYATGSLLGTAAFTGGTLLIGPAVKATQAGLQVARGTRGLEVGAKQAARELGYKEVTVTPVKIGKKGEAIALERGPLGLVYETVQVPIPKITKPPRVDITGTLIRETGEGLRFVEPSGVQFQRTFKKLSLPETYLIEESELGRDIGIAGVRSQRVAINVERATEAQMAAKVGQKVTPAYFKERPPLIEETPIKPFTTRAETATQLVKTTFPEARQMGFTLKVKGGKLVKDQPFFAGPPESMAPVKGLRTGLERGVGKERAGELTAGVGKPKPLPQGTVFGFKVKALKETAKKISAEAQRQKEIKEAVTTPGRKSVPARFKIKPPGKGSKAPLEAIQISRGVEFGGYKLSRATQEAARIATEGKPSRAAAAATAGLLGFGGATGAEKKATKYELVTEFEPTPPGVGLKGIEITGVKGVEGLSITPATAERTKGLEKLIGVTRIREITSVGGGLKEITGLGAKLKLNLQTRLKTEPVESLRPKVAEAQARKTAFTTFTTPRIKIPPPPPPFRPPPPAPRMGAAARRPKAAKRKGGGGTLTYGLGVKNIILPGLSIAPERVKIRPKKAKKAKGRKGKRKS